MAISTVFAFAFASALASASSPLTSSRPETIQVAASSLSRFTLSQFSLSSSVQPEPLLKSAFQPEFSTAIAANLTTQSPRSGGQLYLQRFAALKIGKLYTRLPSDSFSEIWKSASVQPTYEQWRSLLASESKAVSKRTSQHDLSILLGDSLSLWFPCDRLQQSQIWLNQGISGDTTWNVLARLPDLANTRPSQIYLMVGLNDLKMGAGDAEIVWNVQRIIAKLQAIHPNARIIVQSILPTRSPRIPGDRIGGINRQLNEIARLAGATYLDVFSQFVDHDGEIMPEYTTDGIHLSAQGYAAWQSVFQDSDSKVAAAAISDQ